MFNGFFLFFPHLKNSFNGVLANRSAVKETSPAHHLEYLFVFSRGGFVCNMRIDMFVNLLALIKTAILEINISFDFFFFFCI